MSFTEADHQHMSRALELARRGLYTTRPNPRVGCVIVKDGAVVAEGWTAPAGGLHAEARALEVAGAAALDATVYCTLEPCAHFGRTPPCADALVRARPARVVVAAGDPFDRVDGEGLARLRAAGIRVETGLMEAEARALNPGFHARHERGRPWVRLKLAASLDGRTAMASGESRWITGPAARRDVQHLRARSCAIVTGVGTVLADDPRLTLRDEELDDLAAFDREFLGAHPPLRVVLDSTLRTPPAARVLATPEALVVTAAGADGERRAALEARAEVVEAAVDAGRVGLDGVLALLAARDCNEVLLECGPRLAGAALAAGLVDELWLYQAPVMMGAAARPLADLALARMSERLHFETLDLTRIEEDIRWVLRPVARPVGDP
ncbi:MAG TPA: bifunctional diaminohydroxyphosphoribosylaminopyrimidine deaminase/5-amino-6-(5-phosphoribosylamino)uracil reductase RibD [Pseudomonadales bacterium]|nr:bifunctional diaminohydroxyphosphoribosylaminopyrimidine deaminase/5-amino-6-(5-phosphoribosylamino)uracil reductase RibD [Pseudomonadales bacterium]